MAINALPKDEQKRLETLLSYQILDTEEEVDFNSLIALAAQLCETPIALITLLDEQRQWFKAKIGISIKETPRDISFCTHAIHYDEIMVVSDATQDARFVDNPFVTGEYKVRFYAGMPLITADGYKLGALCVMDQKPKDLDEKQLQSLSILAKQVVNLLDLRIQNLNKKAQLQTLLESKERLTFAEERYRGIFENALDGIFQATPDGKFITANLSMARIFGYDSVEELTTSVTDMGRQLTAGSRERRKIKDLLEKHGHAIEYELMTLKKNKETIWILVNIRAAYDDQGDLKHFEGTIKDITEQKKTEIQIIKEKELADTFINSLPGVFYLYNEEGKFLRWNLNFETITGYSAEEIANMHPAELFEEGEDRDRVVSRISEVFEKGYAEVEADFLLKDKRKIPYYFNGWKIDYENQPCLIGVGIDISGRKAAEIELRNSQDKIRAFFHSTPDASVLLGKNFEVLAFNPTANKLTKNTYGYELTEGFFFTDLIFPEMRTMITGYLSKALRGETNRYEFHLSNTKTGTKMWWQAFFMPAYDIDGNIFGIISSLTNINEIKMTELRLKDQFEELQKTNQELDHFVYSVSHDLRAPLASLLGLINIAEMENPSTNFKESLKRMRGSVNRLDAFIKDILDYSQNARREMMVRRVDFKKLVNNSITDLKTIENAERVDVVVEIETPHPFYSDQVRICILLNNLLSNAIKYHDALKASPYVLIQIKTSANSAHIKISDNGIGIKKARVSKIFDMFYQATEKAKGAGLGLYIVRETINKLGGTIKVKSKVDLSTTFEIVIPNIKMKKLT